MGTTSENLRNRLDELMPLSKPESHLENYDHIHLNEDQVKEALRQGREKEHYRLKQIEYRERLMKTPQYPKYNSEQVFEWFGLQYTVDDDNVTIVQELCKYFTGDSRFNGDLNKGLLLAGGVGVGKTTMMKFFMKNQVQSYRMESCREVESKFSADGEQFVYFCSFMIPIATNADPFGHQSVGICFDDLGTEANAKHYGKEKNVMAEIILNRYDNKLPFTATHITTNLTAEELAKQYGSRVTDRMRQMFNIIEFSPETKSRRV